MRKKYILWILWIFLFLSFYKSALGQTQEYFNQIKEYLIKGVKKYNASDFRGALKDWEQGLVVANNIENNKAIGNFLSNIGLVCWNLGDYPKALSFNEQALKIRKEIRDKNGEGYTLNRLGLVHWTLGDYPKAISYYDQALKIESKIGDKCLEGTLLNNIGRVYESLGDYPKALSYFNQALKIDKKLRNKNYFTLSNIGSVYGNLGDYPRALSYYDQALKIEKEIGNKNGEGGTLVGIGFVYGNLGDYPRALSYYDQALKIEKEIGNKNGEGGTLNNIGLVYGNLGDYPRALSYYDQALKIEKEIGNKNGVGTILNNIGQVYQNLGDYPEALSYYDQVLKIIKETGNKIIEGRTLNNIGLIYGNLGNYPKALSYYDQALKIGKEIGNKGGEGPILNNIGFVYGNLGDYPKALSYYNQALKIGKEIGDKNGEGRTLGNIGLVYWNLGDYPKALSYLDHNLKIFKEIGVPTRRAELDIGDVYLDHGSLAEALEIFNRLKSFIHLGRYYLQMKEYQKAREAFSSSLEVNAAKEMPEAVALLADYTGLGMSHEGLKEYSRAKEYFTKGIEFIEKQRGTLGGAEREHFFEAKIMGFSRMEPYEGMIRVLIREKGKDFEKESFFYAERAKSRYFLELLAKRDLGGRKAEDRAILGQEKAFQQDILILKKRIEAMEVLGDKAQKEEMERFKEEYATKEADYEQFIKGIKFKNAELGSLISISPASVGTIQSLLDVDTSLVEFYITQDRTYGWLLTKNDIKVYEISLQKKELQTKMDDLRLLNISDRSRKAEPKITLGVGEEYKKETGVKEREDNRQRFSLKAQDFYEVFFAPVAKDIKTSKLIVAPHGVLHKFPFSTLSDGKKFLIEKYAVSVLPAASVMEFVTKKRKPGKDKLLVLANPKTDYIPLVFSEKEGQALASLFSQNEIYYREKATETLAKKKASGFNIIHFASHGEFNDRQPMQSGLLLARDDENDGYLQVHEIFGLDLENANLVTLSACETALCSVRGGDDLVGLSRGFIYAGTPSLLATLWKVDDASTAILMELFYRNWQKGMTKPEALRQAQLTLKSMPQYSHPFYWAPFVMIGDWK